MLQRIIDLLVEAKVIHQEVHTFTNISLRGIQSLLEIVKLIMVCTIIVLRMLYIIVIIQRRSLRDSLQLALMSRIFILMMMPSLFFPIMPHMILSFILLNFLNLWIYLSAGVLRRHRMMNLF